MHRLRSPHHRAALVARDRFSSIQRRWALVNVGTRGAQMSTFYGGSGGTSSSSSSSSGQPQSFAAIAEAQHEENATQVGLSAEEAAALSASATTLMRFRVQKPEVFYFSRGDSVCRLCNEYISDKQVRFHLVGAGPRGPSTHMGREIILDTLVYYFKQGYDPRRVVRSWPHVLLAAPQYVRLPHLLPADVCDLKERASRVTALLQGLKGLGVLDISVSPHSEQQVGLYAQRYAFKRRIAFERLECIGDNAWGSNISGRMMLVFSDKRWAHCNMYHSFNTFRDIAETNTNLERMYDLLQLSSLLPAATRDLVGEGKIKADVLEAILGELDTVLYAHESNMLGVEEYMELNDEHLDALCNLIRHVLNEIFDLTLLCLVYFLAEHAVAVANELVLEQIFPPKRPALDVGDAIRTRRPQYNKNFVPTFALPRPPSVHSDALASRELGRTAAEKLVIYGPGVNGAVARHRVDWTTVSRRLGATTEFAVSHETARAGERGFVGTMFVPRDSHDPDAHSIAYGLSPARGEAKAAFFSKPTTMASASRLPPLGIQPPISTRRAAGYGTAADATQGHRWGRHCRFTLSPHPPHAYNPYGLSADAWTSMWQSGAPEGIFHPDVLDSVPVVLAQFEATATLRRDKHDTTSSGATAGGGGLSTIEGDYHQQVDRWVCAHEAAAEAAQQQQLQQRLQQGIVALAASASASAADTATAASAVTSTTSGGDGSAGQASGEVDASLEDDDGHEGDAAFTEPAFELLRTAYMQRAHPFADGVAVGTEGASFASLSTAIADAAAAAARRIEALVAIDRAASGSSGATADAAGGDSEGAEAPAAAAEGRSDSAEDGATGATTLTGDINFDEIKRRNSALRRGMNGPRKGGRLTAV